MNKIQLRPIHTQRLVQIGLWILTLLTLAILLFIIIFILVKGIKVISYDFLFTLPVHMGKAGGILSTIVGTIYLTLLAILIATPIGIGSAVYLTEYTRENIFTKVIRFGADCLAGIPSIIFGLFGFILFVIKFGWGWSLLSGGFTLAFMILPTIIRTSEEAIRAVPISYREVSMALGASKWQTVSRVVLPNALPGILTGVILSIGRCIAETACVIFTAGSSLRLPTSLFDSTRTMAVHFYILTREGISMERAYGTAVILIAAIIFVNFLVYWVMERFIQRYAK
ncbi:MAG: phosphate ABC transporter permease PstA [candidate division WOR-3 bacterium]